MNKLFDFDAVHKWIDRWWPWLLLGILLYGAVLRYYNLNWDGNRSFHPDERNVVNVILRIDLFHDLDPEFYAYGALFMYLARGIAESLAFITRDAEWTKDAGMLHLLVRFISATFSASSVVLMYVVGRQFFRRRVTALLLSFLLASCVGLIQYAHYGVTESLLVWYVLLLIYSTQSVLIERQDWKWMGIAALMGAIAGTKTAGLIFGVIPGIAFLQSYGKLFKKSRTWWVASVMGIVFLCVFFLSSPYTWLNSSKFFESMEYEHDVVKGTYTVPYTVQFLNTPRYLFQFVNLHWQMGVFLPMLIVISFVTYFKQLLRQKNAVRSQYFSVVLFSVLYFLYVGSWFAKFSRYMLPLIPGMLILLGWWWEKGFEQKTRKKQSLFMGGTLLIILTQLIWSGAYIQMYMEPHTHVQASAWIYQNVPKGSVILQEEWDQGVPTYFDGMYYDIYNFKELPLYREDSAQKMSEVAELLQSSDYLTISSHRLTGSVGRASEKYPYSSEYYSKLFMGKLGYTQVFSINNSPEIFGWRLPEYVFEESLQVYDHPDVYIFYNERKLPQQQLFNELMDISEPHCVFCRGIW